MNEQPKLSSEEGGTSEGREVRWLSLVCMRRGTGSKLSTTRTTQIARTTAALLTALLLLLVAVTAMGYRQSGESAAHQPGEGRPHPSPSHAEQADSVAAVVKRLGLPTSDVSGLRAATNAAVPHPRAGVGGRGLTHPEVRAHL